MPSEVFLAELKEQYNCELKWSKVKDKILIMADSEEINQNVADTLREEFGLRPVTQTAVCHGQDNRMKLQLETRGLLKGCLSSLLFYVW